MICMETTTASGLWEIDDKLKTINHRMAVSFINLFLLSLVLNIQIQNMLLTWWKLKEKIIHSVIEFISYLSTTFLSASSLNIINIINPNDKMADPPLLKKGRGIPITGANPITIAILIIKWKNKIPETQYP